MGFKINEYNSTLNRKLQRGLKIIGKEKGLSQNENKEFIFENKFKSSFIRIFNKLFKNFGEFIQFCPSSKSFKNSIILSKAFW